MSLAKQIILFFFLGLGATEVHEVVYYIWPQTYNIQFDIFLSPSYKQQISVLWYIFELGNILNWMFWVYGFSRIAAFISDNFVGFRPLYYVSLVIFAYRITQFLFYIWNRNTSFLSNLSLYLAMGFVFTELLIPEHRFKKHKWLVYHNINRNNEVRNI